MGTYRRAISLRYGMDKRHLDGKCSGEKVRKLQTERMQGRRMEKKNRIFEVQKITGKDKHACKEYVKSFTGNIFRT